MTEALDPSSLSALGERFDLPADVLEKLRRFGALLATDEFAPTTVREPQRVHDDHLADSLVALDLELVRSAERIADLGSGAGVPGIPLALALPNARVTLLEGNRRKCDFMRRAVSELSLPNVEIVHGRAETWREGLGAMDLVTARALAPPEVVAEYAAPLLRHDGALVAWCGLLDPGSEAALNTAADVLGMAVRELRKVQPYPSATNRYLQVVVKVAETPERFPRRDGVARKRPLGRS